MIRNKRNIVFFIFFLLMSVQLYSNVAIDNALIWNDAPIFSEASMIVYLKDFPNKIVTYKISDEKKEEYEINEYEYIFKNSNLIKHYVNNDYIFEYYFKNNLLIKIKETVIGYNEYDEIEFEYYNSLLKKKKIFYNNKLSSEIEYFYDSDKRLVKMIQYRCFGQKDKAIEEERIYIYKNYKLVKVIRNIDFETGEQKEYEYTYFSNNTVQIKGPDLTITRKYNDCGLILSEKAKYHGIEWNIKSSEIIINYDDKQRLKTYEVKEKYEIYGIDHYKKVFCY